MRLHPLLFDLAFYTDSHTHEHLQMLEIPCTQLMGKPEQLSPPIFTMYILHKGETMGKTRAAFTFYV